MQRDVLLLTEMIDAAEQAHRLTADITVSQLEADRQRRDALLWNFSPRLLVHRPGSPAHHRHRATTRIHSQLAHRPEQRH
jgi:hypothetical protein